jgi:hypothetical protein
MSFDGIQRCAVCRRAFDTAPVFRADTRYCCGSCASGRLCSCLIDVDAGDDGVDGLGLSFVLRPAGVASEELVTARR